MNVAILYDATENAEVGAEELLAGEPLFFHSLKQFYLHPCIDYVVMVWREIGIGSRAMQYVEQWREMYGVMKPSLLFYGTDNLQNVLAELEQQEKENVDLYIFHDIRYPCVTSNMIYMVAQKAAIYGLAVTAGNIDENTILISENKYIEENFRYLKYPIAMTVAHKLRGKISRNTEMLRLYSEERPYLCNIDEKNPVAYSSNDIELIEAIMYLGQKGKRGEYRRGISEFLQ